VLALVALLYLARLPEEWLIRTAFGLVALGLRLVDCWILAGGAVAIAHHDALQADLAAEGGYSTRHALRLRPDPDGRGRHRRVAQPCAVRAADGRAGGRRPQHHGRATNVTRLPEDNRDPARYARRLDSWRKLAKTAGASWRLMPDPADVVTALRAT
jgi:hypothetical protein